jgi:hypothetical protein
MWTSYEALCEMGAVDIDPTSVFGVRPSEIDQLQEHLHKPQNMMPLQEKSVLSPSFNFSQHHATPMMEAVKPLQPMDLGTPSSAGSIPKTSLFQTAQKPKGVTPNQLQFETPNLTPIPHQQDASFTAPSSASFVDMNNPNTIRRAKHVAARLYYQPSPETTDSARRGPSRYLRGRSALFTDQSSISETPLRRGGRPSEGSTARKPRALFLTSENKTNNTKPEVDDEDEFDDRRRRQEEPQQQEEQEKQVATPALSNEKVNMDNENEDDIIDRHSAVQEILELFCLLGAGYWRLCQVCNRIDGFGGIRSVGCYSSCTFYIIVPMS